MEYPHALNLMYEHRVYLPSIVQLRDKFYIFSRTELLGSGWTIREAMEDAKLYPQRPTNPAVLFVTAGSDVLQGGENVCVARSPNTAARIANALNRYKPSPRGF